MCLCCFPFCSFRGLDSSRPLDSTAFIVCPGRRTVAVLDRRMHAGDRPEAETTRTGVFLFPSEFNAPWRA